MRDPVADHIHAALGLPPPGEEQPRRRRDPVVVLADAIDRAADDWLRGRSVAKPDARTIEQGTAHEIREAFEALDVDAAEGA